MTTTVAPLLSIKVPARAAALAWVNAFLAAGKDESRPALNRTLSIEVFETLRHSGLHLVGCDGTALFRTWVPALPDAEWPNLDLAPEHRLVVSDIEGFAHGFLKTLLALTGQEGYAGAELTLTLETGDSVDEPALGEALQPRRLVLEACGQRLDLRLYEGAYPNWRGVDFGINEAERVEGLTFAPRLLGLLGRFKGPMAVDLAFAGETRAVRFVARGEAEVRGLLMPMRRPEVRKPESADEEDDE